MLKIKEGVHIYFFREPVDMRKAIDGLTTLLALEDNWQLQSGDLFIFRNKAGDKIKLIHWDINGFGLYYKRIEKGRFPFPKQLQEPHLTLTADQLSWLLAGLDFVLMGQNSHLNFENYF